MQWQYKTAILDAPAGFLKNKIDPTTLDATLNQLGRDRWELVSVFVLSGEMTRDIMAIFKRPTAHGRQVSEVRGACPACGYDLRGADHDACPECGWRAVPDASTPAE